MSALGLRWTRLANLVPILFGITVLCFLLIRIVPGDPATQMLGNHYTAAAAARVRAGLGLDGSLPSQYWTFLKGALTGSFGTSYQYHRPVGQLLAERTGPSLLLVGMTAVFCALISVPLGIGSAVRAGGVLDQVTRVFFTVGYALPAFLVGVVLILLLGLELPLFPIGGYSCAPCGPRPSPSWSRTS